ncbi:MAG: hypothetical protein ABFC71_03100 [Methanoregula sp.]
MNEDLAKKILRTSLDWTTDEIRDEMSTIQLMASYKYDNYQRFFPGMRFIESLSQWLNQFKTIEERKVAYEFIKKRLIFFSEREIEQLVSMSYPDLIKPILYEKTASNLHCSEYQIKKIFESTEFKILQRKSLFLGLSDGAHMDLFRRMNREVGLKHDQISIGYDINDTKRIELLEELKNDLEKIPGCSTSQENLLFKNIFLIDDFSASGKSYFHIKNGEIKGKVAKVMDQINNPDSEISKIIDKSDLLVCVILYIATDTSLNYLRPLLNEIAEAKKFKIKIVCIQKLDDQTKIQNGEAFLKLIENDAYYDSDVESNATMVGGTKSVKLGFANCALPVILYHNTPNDSVAILWLHEYLKIKGLFPRVTRH